MPHLGGQSTITGVEFELWFVALKFCDVFFDENISVKPQAQTFENPQTKKTELVGIDDVVVSNCENIEFYNIKFRSPDIKEWTFSQLKQGKVWEQFKSQFLKTPNADLYFVSQSPCPIFAEILPRGANCESRGALEIELSANNYIQKWDEIKNELIFTDEQMFEFAKKVKYKAVIDIFEIQKTIKQVFSGHLTNASFVANTLYHLATESAKKGKNIKKSNIIEHFEKNDIHLKSHNFTKKSFEILKDNDRE